MSHYIFISQEWNFMLTERAVLNLLRQILHITQGILRQE